MILLRPPAVEHLIGLALIGCAFSAGGAPPDTCRGLRGEEFRACHRERLEQLPPRLSDCAKRRLPDELVSCESYNRRVEICRTRHATEARACMDRLWREPMKMVRSGLNPLDCAAPAKEFAAACELHRELVAACTAMEPAARAACLRRYERYTVLDCAGLQPAQRGRCAAHNHGLKACRSQHGAELKACHASFTAMPDGEHYCGVYDRPAAEGRYCAALDRAYAKCAAGAEPAQQFQSCVQASLPASYWIQRRLRESAPIVK